MTIYEELKAKYTEIEMYTEESGDFEDIAVEEFRKENYKLAIENFQKVIVAIPDHYNAYEMCSYALYKSGDSESAIKYLETAIAVTKAFDAENTECIMGDIVEDMEKSLETMKSGSTLDKAYIDAIME